MISEQTRYALAVELGAEFVVQDAVPVAGGCFGETWRLATSAGCWFLKQAPREQFARLEAESRGLQELALSDSVQVPEVLALGSSGDSAFLLLPYLDLHPLGAESARMLGHQLARLHDHRADRFGWQYDNFIGANPQRNRWSGDWLEFFPAERIRFQLNLAAAQPAWSNADEDSVLRLLEHLGDWFEGYKPAASLLHGDLWAGNAGALANGKPVIFDPAVYYGDREADLAMCALFGGFPPAFFAAYQEAWPLEPGYEQRRDLYQLYHVLNHLNLFGGGYAAQARELVRRLWSNIR